MSDSFQILALGLPASGKTTFLAALWHAVTANDLSPQLRLSRAPDDRQYLMALENDWLACRQVERTLRTAEQYNVFLPVRSAMGQELTISFPDLAGETIEAQWANRTWSPAYATLAARADGLLVFVNPTKYREIVSIAHINELRESVAVRQTAAGAEAASPWRPEDTPTQVQLVEVLQFILDGPHRSARIAVILSAWDSVCDVPHAPSPMGWLEERAALLHQFLSTRLGIGSFRVFGVSAQGGTLPRDAARLQAYVQAAERIRVVSDTGESHDITDPLAWLAGVKRE
jgi:hypothetical protein